MDEFAEIMQCRECGASFKEIVVRPGGGHEPDFVCPYCESEDIESAPEDEEYWEEEE